MKRSRSVKGSNILSTAANQVAQKLSNINTPLIFNQNSNSCSNDTNFSAHSNNPEEGQILLKENKIRSLLKELQYDVKKCQDERDKIEPNLIQIAKTHEKLKKEEKRELKITTIDIEEIILFKTIFGRYCI
jgi:hypothetical protein